MKYTHIFFDVDGTIMDSEKAAVQSFVKTLSELNIPIPEKEELVKIMGSSTTETMNNLNLSDPESAVLLWQKNALAAFAGCKPFDDVIDTLHALRDMGYRLGIVTSRAKAEIENDLSFNSYLPLFDIGVFSDEVSHIKPSPEPLLKAMEKAEVTADSCLYIGDSKCDFECASAANMDFMLALWGARNADSIPCDIRLSSPRDIMKYL